MTLKLTRKLISGLNFWPAALFRRVKLFFRSGSVSFVSCKLDRAFYVQGELIVLEWEVESAWMVKLSSNRGLGVSKGKNKGLGVSKGVRGKTHQIQRFVGSGAAVLIAHPDLKEIVLIARGPGGPVRMTVPVFVKPYARKGRLANLESINVRTDHLHRGPQLKQKGLRIAQVEGFRVRSGSPLRSFTPGGDSSGQNALSRPTDQIEKDLESLKQANSLSEFQQIASQLKAQYALSESIPDHE